MFDLGNVGHKQHARFTKLGIVMFNKLSNITSFKSSCSYAEFCEATRQKYRYIHNDRVTKFLDAVLATSKKRQTVIPEGSLFWRAQLGHDWGHHAFEDPNGNEIEYIGDDPSAHLEGRMTPIPNSAKEGRANPKGISYLYLATHEETAMSCNASDELGLRPSTNNGIMRH